MTIENKIISLEEIVAHQALEISRLSDELYFQQKQLAILQQELERVRSQLKSLAQSESIIRSIDEETPPPHY